MNTQLLHGDCLERLKELPDNSVDSVVTDPPYGLSFMGKKWDYDVPSEDIWRECLRVLKPGGHLLAFAGTRTQHRMAVRIEDAGFEIRDMIAWIYGSGFPKSHDVSKAVWAHEIAGGSSPKKRRMATMGEGYSLGETAGRIGVEQSMERVRADAMPVDPEKLTDAARQWQGFGTALKPAFESLTYATKPLDCLGYCAKMIANLNQRIEACRLIANNAEKNLRPFQADLQEERTSIAPGSAATRTEEAPANEMGTGAEDDTNSRADTLESIREAEHTALSTLLSWRNTLGGVSDAMRTSTTATVFETITDWKILSYCLSQITPDIITKARSNPSGLSADALRAVEYLNVSLACCESTLALSALAPAMSQEAENCQDAGVSPNLDPIILARKPLVGTVAANVLQHGTGAINVDGCRVGTEPPAPRNAPRKDIRGGKFHSGAEAEMVMGHYNPTQGRWPANLIHDGSDEVVGLFPVTTSGGSNGTRKSGPYSNDRTWNTSQTPGASVSGGLPPDTGSAARFFYVAKASKRDRDEGLDGFELKAGGLLDQRPSGDFHTRLGDGPTQPRKNNHPTVKPTDLMRYLCRLVTPPGGTVLDPFMGSGSTGKAAMLEGFRFIGIEREAEYLEIAKARIEHAKNQQSEILV